MNRDSGAMRGKRTIFGGRATVRCALYMATFAATKFSPIIRVFAERLKKTGKPFKVVIIAAMRKLLTILNVMIKENQPWNPKLKNAWQLIQPLQSSNHSHISLARISSSR